MRSYRSLGRRVWQELQLERAASAVVAQRVTDVEARHQQQLQQLRQDGEQLKVSALSWKALRTLFQKANRVYVCFLHSLPKVHLSQLSVTSIW